jgi:UDP-glucose-4-epimerase GalE
VHVLVTGGAGYIGSFVCRALHRSGLVPITYDNLSRGTAANVRWGPLEAGDITDATRLEAVFQRYRPEAVVHLAALAYVGESIADPGLYYRNNVTGGIRLFEVMHANGVRNIVFSSSCAVYGNPATLPVPETAPINPISPYGRSKVILEQILSDYRAAFGLHAVSLRYFNAGGADAADDLGECHDPEPHIIPCALAAAAGRQAALEINGNDYPTPDGTCVRDFVHVADLADAHVQALRYVLDGGARPAFNLGCGQAVSIQELIHTVRAVTGRDMAVVVKQRRAGDPACLVADIGAAVEQLKFRPRQSTIEAIVGSAWAWHSRQWDVIPRR